MELMTNSDVLLDQLNEHVWHCSVCWIAQKAYEDYCPDGKELWQRIRDTLEKENEDQGKAGD